MAPVVSRLVSAFNKVLLKIKLRERERELERAGDKARKLENEPRMRALKHSGKHQLLSTHSTHECINKFILIKYRILYVKIGFSVFLVLCLDICTHTLLSV